MAEERRVLHLVLRGEPPEGGTVVRLDPEKVPDPEPVLDLILRHEVVVTW